MPLQPRDPKDPYKSLGELVAHAKTLATHTAGELAKALGKTEFNAGPKPKGKTGVGTLVELYLGKKADNLQAPDFAKFNTELKTLPMKAIGRGKSEWTVKEPTSITMIDYRVVEVEDWSRAYVRHKFENILWVPYEHNYQDKRKSRFRSAFLWQPPAEDEPVLRGDYDTVRGLVVQQRAHELSESISQVLAARRKGAKGSTSLQRLGPAAKSRAWAFKTAYTRPILAKHVLAQPQTSIIAEAKPTGAAPAIRTLADVMPYVEHVLAAYRGKSLADLARSRGAKVSGGKAGPAAFVRHLMGIKGRGQIVEFEKLGIRIQTVWAHPDTKYPWEAVSFPAMNLGEFGEEEWAEAELQDLVDRILFIPLYSTKREAGPDRVLGKPFFWSPSPDEWAGIQREWKRYQAAVNAGKARYRPVKGPDGKPRRTAKGRPVRENALPKMTDTRFVHMRPHGQDSRDVDVDPKGNKVTKQCFWLNKSYLQSILESHA
ncbi:MAG: MutH/Sau3AI family endonuclease [Candidatus Thermoplasmatota archaeon]